MILEKERLNGATNEATGAATSRRYGNTITSGEGQVNYNGRIQPLQNNAMTVDSLADARMYGNTITSGEGKVNYNGITANAAGKNLGNMADVTAGVKTLKDSLSTPAYGLDPSRIGLDENTGYMMYDGQDTGVKATDYSGGVNDSNRTMLSDAYKRATGDEVVSGRQYAEINSGLGANAMRWQDGKVYLGGHEVPYQYVDADGNAHISKKVLDSVIEQVRAENGIKRGTDIVNDVYGKYADEMSKQMNKIINRDEWSYNPNRDPVYAAYADMYRQNAEQAYNRAMGMGGLYSRPTSYQRQNALSGYNDQMQALSNAIPELAQNDYNRYYNDQMLNRQALSALQNERYNELNAFYGANADEISRMREADETNYNREWNANERNYSRAWNANERDYSRAWNANERDYSRAYDEMYGYPMDAARLKSLEYQNSAQQMQNDIAKRENEMLQLQYDEQKRQNIMNAATLRGSFTEEEAAWLGVPPDTNPWKLAQDAVMGKYNASLGLA